MQESNKFFIWIYRINSLLFLLVLSAATVGVVIISSKASEWERKREVEVKDNESEEKSVTLRFGNIEELEGFDIQVIKLYSEQGEGRLSLSSYDHTIRNLLFLSKELTEGKWLFQTSQHLISVFDPLEPDSIEGKNRTIIALYYEIVKEDSNMDGKLSSEDNTVVALSRPDGSRYSEVLRGVGRIMGHQVVSHGSAVAVLYEQEGKVMYVLFSLDSFSKIKELQVSQVLERL